MLSYPSYCEVFSGHSESSLPDLATERDSPRALSTVWTVSYLSARSPDTSPQEAPQHHCGGSGLGVLSYPLCDFGTDFSRAVPGAKNTICAEGISWHLLPDTVQRERSTTEALDEVRHPGMLRTNSTEGKVLSDQSQ